jgi:hypothetical protein
MFWCHMAQFDLQLVREISAVNGHTPVNCLEALLEEGDKGV